MSFPHPFQISLATWWQAMAVGVVQKLSSVIRIFSLVYIVFYNIVAMTWLPATGSCVGYTWQECRNDQDSNGKQTLSAWFLNASPRKYPPDKNKWGWLCNKHPFASRLILVTACYGQFSFGENYGVDHVDCPTNKMADKHLDFGD